MPEGLNEMWGPSLDCWMQVRRVNPALDVSAVTAYSEAVGLTVLQYKAVFTIDRIWCEYNVRS